MATLADYQNLEREFTVQKAVAAAVNEVGLLSTLRGSSNVDDAGMGGFYSDEDDSYTGYWLMGEELGSAPLKEL